MTLSDNAQWILGCVSDASRGADPKAIDAWIAHHPRERTAALQELLDLKLVAIREKGRYWLTVEGQRLVDSQREVPGGAA